MKVVHIARFYGLNGTGGAAIASTRLHLALLALGVESHYICVQSSEKGMNVYELPQKGSISRILFFWGAKVLRGIWRWSHYKRSISLNALPLPGLKSLLRTISPDVVHVHWINCDVVSYEQLASLRKILPNCKFVVNLHDLFMLNAIAPYPLSDTRYQVGFNRKNSRLLERWLFSRKLSAIRRLSPVFVGPSEWVVSCCRQSLIGRGLDAYAIPNLIDTNVFQYWDEPQEHTKFRVLYGAVGGRKNPIKGFEDLRTALNLLPLGIKERVELQVFGEESTESEIDGFPLRFWGCITDPHQMSHIYRQADVFAFPSRTETQGMTKIEAMLCGLPVVSFDYTACAEGVDHCKTGWISPGGDVVSFAKGIEWAFNEGYLKRDENFHREIAKRSAEQFCPKSIVGRILSLYHASGDVVNRLTDVWQRPFERNL